MARVLVVDDEAPIVDAISYNLKKEGFTVDTAADADECLLRIQTDVPDVVVLHQERADLPVLLLTARAAEEDRLKGFGAGADDYVVKPFSMRELVARVHALLRRAGREASLVMEPRISPILSPVQGLQINADRR